MLEILGVPGHQRASIAVYDPQTGVLITGDIVYPGHLFVFSAADWIDFVASIERLVDWAATHPVQWVLGCHIEWSSQPGGCLTWGTPAHPDERVLELSPHVLKKIHVNAQSMGATPVSSDVPEDFVIHPVYLCPINGGC